MSLGPLRRDRHPVVCLHVFAFTSCNSKNYDCHQPPVRKVLVIMLCPTLTDVCHMPNEPPAKRTVVDGDRREGMRSAAAARHAWLSSTAFPTKSSPLSIISYEKALQVFEEKELDHRSAVRSCQAGGSGKAKGSGVDEWHCMKLVWEFKCILVHVHIGMAIKLLFCTKSLGGGESKQILREYGFKKAEWPIGYGVGLRIKRSSVLSYLAILVKYILAKKKNFENYGKPLKPICSGGP